MASSAQHFFVVLGVGFHLSNDHVVVDAAGAHELLVGSTLDDAPFFHQQDHVGAPYG